MAKGILAALPGNFRAAATLIILLTISFVGYAQTYNPSQHVTINAAIGEAQATPLDARSMFFDPSLFLYRPYQNTSEVLSYLNLAKYRTGNFIIVVDSGGTLQFNGTYLNGHNVFYMFRDSVGNANLVKMSLFGESSGCSGCLLAANNLSDLQSITTAKTNLSLNNVDNTSDATKWAATATFTNKTISGLSNTFSNIPISALAQNSIGLSITSVSAANISVTTTPATLGNSLIVNIPTSSPTNRGALQASDFSFFKSKLDSTHLSNDTLYNCSNGLCVVVGVVGGGGGGSGTVTLFSSHDLTGFFTTNVTTATTTPNQTFSFVNPPAFSIWGDSTGSTATPFYFVPNSTTLGNWFGGPIQGALTLTTIGSSGTATLIGNTLNIPVYGGGGGTDSGIAVLNGILATRTSGPTVFLQADSGAYATRSRVQKGIDSLGVVKQPVGSYLTGLSGDVVAAGPGIGVATIQANAITTTKIINNAVTLAKMATNTVNTLLGYDGSGNAGDVTLGTGLALSSGVLSVTSVTGVSSVSNSDGTITSSPTSGAVVVSLTLTHANTWAGGSPQTFNSGIAMGSSITFSANNTYNVGSISDVAAHVWARVFESEAAVSLQAASGNTVTLDINAVPGLTLLSTGQLQFNNYTGSGFAGTANDSILTINPANGQVGWRSGQPFNIYPVNGLQPLGNTLPNDSLGLGGTLYRNTTISGSNAFAFILDSMHAASGRGFKVNFGSDAGWDLFTKDSATGFWTRIGKGTPGQSLQMLLSGGIGWGNQSGGGTDSGIAVLNGILASRSGTGPTVFLQIDSGAYATRSRVQKGIDSLGAIKQATGNYITALTGDVVAAGPGSAASTIQANAVTTSKINNNAVTYAKIQAASGQALLGATAAGNYQEITLGTNLSMSGGVLNASGSGSTPVNNALFDSSGTKQFGEPLGQSGNPAQLFSSREVPNGGKKIIFYDSLNNSHVLSSLSIWDTTNSLSQGLTPLKLIQKGNGDTTTAGNGGYFMTLEPANYGRKYQSFYAPFYPDSTLQMDRWYSSYVLAANNDGTFNGGMPDAVIDYISYNEHNGASRINLKDGAWRFGAEGNYLGSIGSPTPNLDFEFHIPAVTNFAGHEFRINSFYVNKTNGTALDNIGCDNVVLYGSVNNQVNQDTPYIQFTNRAHPTAGGAMYFFGFNGSGNHAGEINFQNETGGQTQIASVGTGDIFVTSNFTRSPSFGMLQQGDLYLNQNADALNASGHTVIGNLDYNGANLIASAQLQVFSTNRGSIPAPKMTTTQQNAISSPVAGLLVWNTDSSCLVEYNGSAWLKISPNSGGSGVTTVGTFSGSSQTNGASISGSTITFGPADATNSGMVTTGAQTILGAKSFSTAIYVGGTYSGGGNSAEFSLTGNISVNSGISTRGTWFNLLRGNTVTDGSGGGTVAGTGSAYFGDQTLAATAATTYSDAATLYVNGPPAAGTNVTLTRAWSIYTPTGNSFLGTGLTTGIANVLHVLGVNGVSSTPTIAAGTGAGTSPTVSIQGTDMDGLLTVTTGVTPSGTGATIVTITYNTSYPTHTYVSLTAADGTTALLSGATMVFVTGSTTTFTVNSGTTGLTGATTYHWYYHVGGF